MDFAAPRSESLAVRRQHHGDPSFVAPDYFLIVDADEIYEAGTLERLAAYVSRDRKPLYRVPCVRYFKRWNYRIDGYEWTIALVLAVQRLPYLRLRKPNLLRRGARGAGHAARLASTTPRLRRHSALVGVFHHAAMSALAHVSKPNFGVSATRTKSIPTGCAAVWDAWTPDTLRFQSRLSGPLSSRSASIFRHCQTR